MFGISTTISSKPKARPLSVPAGKSKTADLEAEYNATAEALGLSFRTTKTSPLGVFLSKHDLPTFHLGEVIKYMDRIAWRDNPNRTGWVWVQLRPRVDLVNFQHGTSVHKKIGFDRRGEVLSDYYHPQSSQCCGPYNKTIPLSALRKITKIEDGLGKDKVAFMVSDYNTKVGWNVDPFLMAVWKQTGARYVIDFWDEPSFGIAQMLK